ncbi:MAG: GGDEF domain-containing protein [Verrucomicrobia bacterium]|nr:GGDEF domain-containing protein [Verrucomicrobiota bacterium]
MPSNRVLLLIENQRFARMFTRWLQDECHLISDWDEANFRELPFDLLLADRVYLKKYSSQISEYRQAAHPVFLPSLLLLPLRTSRIPNKLLGKTVDDVLIHPFGKDEVNARVKNLLRLRRMSEDLKKKHDQVAHLSVTDDVSGFHNTRYLHRHLDRLLANSTKDKPHHSLIFFDIDDFKLVVDSHGHLLGAKTLKEIAEAVDGCLDTYDRIVRYGGDEFVVILPRQSKEEAIRKTVRIKEAVATTPYLQKESIDLHITASFGIATFPEDAKDKRSLLAQADQCLFESKDHGKNRIKVHGQDSDSFIV